MVRTRVPAIRRVRPAVDDPAVEGTGFQPDPYVDYGRFLTAEGGILIVYKDIDLRWRHTLWRLFAWITATLGDGGWLLHQAPLHGAGLNLACLLAIAVVNWLIVAKPVELYRSIEIRPDGMILDGTDMFWLPQMGWPAFQPGPDGHQHLRGIYGTRLVEYAIIRRFDEFDCTPEVIAAHLQDAMQQLWTRLP